MIDHLRAIGPPVNLCTIGPMTNLGELLQRGPDLTDRVRLVLMAGSMRCGYSGKPQPDAEWNMRREIEAFQAVFTAPWGITIAPLDTCGTIQLRGGAYRRATEANAIRARVVMENYASWVNRPHQPPDASGILSDTLTIHLCYTTEGLNIKTPPLRLEEKGFTRVDGAGG